MEVSTVFPQRASSVHAFDSGAAVAAHTARVEGLDLSKPLDASTLAQLREAWTEFLVLVFPDQELTVSQQMAFAEQFLASG